MNTHQTALVLFSGGQDSATCLAWALNRFHRVETVGFAYGQRHDIEMSCRENVRKHIKTQFPSWGEKLGPDHVLDIPVLGQISDTALTREAEIVLRENNLPNTFVPGRNLIFLNFAAALAYRRGISQLVAGMCEADFSGYPDCRKDTLDAAMTAINLGMEETFTLHTPLMTLSKAGAWALCETLGDEKLVQIVNEHSHTCYLGERGTRHKWGYGCGHCPACALRAKGWAEYRP